MCIYGLLVLQLVYILSIKFITFDQKKKRKVFVLLVMQCVEIASYFVVVNGSYFGRIYHFFPGMNGVHQGDSLSPYLFIACM